MKTAVKLHRRAFLRGLGATAISLPLLEIMLDRSAAAEELVPRRFIVTAAGISTGRTTDLFTPFTVGPRYLDDLHGEDAVHALVPLRDLQDDISVVSGLTVPWATAGSVPRAGRGIKFHESGIGPIVTGVRDASAGDNIDNAYGGPSCDQIVGGSVGAETRFPTLELRVQTESYTGGPQKGRMSARADGSGGFTGIDPITSPRLLYDLLFSDVVGTDPAEAARREAELARGRSVIDLVGRRADGLYSRLGVADRNRLQEHFDQIRDMEGRLSALPVDRCIVPTDPGPDPEIYTRAFTVADTTYTIGYSNEDLRGRVMADLVVHAMRCDLTRSVSMQHTFRQCWMSGLEVTGYDADFHELTHSGSSLRDAEERMAACLRWHMEQYGYLVRALRSAAEADATLLDRSAVAFFTEGGHGFDPDSGDSDNPHSTENMTMLLAGRAGGLAAGRHIVAAGRHPAEVLLSGMRAVGVEGALGEVDTTVEELFAV